VNEWMDRGNCLSVDPELFQPGVGGSVQEAKGVCRRCDVVNECLTWALATPGVSGVVGATTPRERSQMRKMR
jgi:WhiB family transcriptional regulator, redox-sensing transcriptional regulator